MVSLRKNRQSNRCLLSHLDDFDQDVIIGSATNNVQENTTVKEGTADQEYTVGKSGSGQTVNDNVVYVKTLERCSNEKIDREMSNNNGRVENRIQNAILAALDSIFTLKIEFAIRSINTSS